MDWELSSYFSLETHIFLTVSREARIEPPIHVEYSLSRGADIVIFTSFRTSFFTSLSSLSPKPLNRVEPPERIMLEKSVRRKSMSDFWIANTSMDTFTLLANQVWPEQQLRGLEPGRADLNGAAIGQVALSLLRLQCLILPGVMDRRQALSCMDLTMSNSEEEWKS